jgi:hypothetical protein
MNEWDEYRVSPKKSAINEWDEYRVSPKKKIVKEGDSWPALIGKSALKGLSTIADIPSMVARGSEKVINLGRKTKGNPSEVYWNAQDPNSITKPKITTIENAPQTNYGDYIPTSEELRSGIKDYTGVDLEPKPVSPAQRIVSHGVDFGTSMAPWAVGGKTLSLADKFKNAAKASKGATAVGLSSGALQETGVNPFAADVVASVATPSVRLPTLKQAFETPSKLKAKIAGVGPSKINIEAARAARDLGIDLPATVLTDSTLTALADQTISKTPYYGNVLKNKYDQVQEKAFNNLKNVYDEIGPIRTPEVSKKINDLYNERRKALPKGSVIVPTSTAAKLAEIEESFVSDISSPGRVELKKYISKLRNKIDSSAELKNKIDPKIYKEHGSIKLPLQEYQVNKLLDAKVNINDIVKHDLKGDPLDRLMEINHAISDDLARYGETNPEWYKKFKKADNYFASVAKRESTEKRLRNQATMDDPTELSYATLNNTINSRDNLRLLKRDTSPETFEKIKKLGIVSKAMVQKNRRVPNPSGTAATAGALVLISGAVLDPSTLISGSGALGLISAASATHLLTDKKFLDLALTYAEEKGKAKLSTAMKLNKRAKDITGYTLNSIYRASRDLNKEEGEDELQ